MFCAGAQQPFFLLNKFSQLINIRIVAVNLLNEPRCEVKERLSSHATVALTCRLHIFCSHLIRCLYLCRSRVEVVVRASLSCFALLCCCCKTVEYLKVSRAAISEKVLTVSVPVCIRKRRQSKPVKSSLPVSSDCAACLSSSFDTFDLI